MKITHEPLLQAALGELTFESEAAGGLRAELRAAQQEAASLQQQVQQSQQEVQDGQAAVRAAQQAAADASQGTHQHLRLERQLQVPSCLAAHTWAAT